MKLLVTAAGLRLRARGAGRCFWTATTCRSRWKRPSTARVVAFARVSADGRAAIAIAPHLVSRLVTAEHPVPLRRPLAHVARPPAEVARRARPTATSSPARRSAPRSAGEHAWLFVGQALQTLPVALLMAG